MLSAAGTMVRNLYIVNSRLFKPTLFCAKNTVPGEVSLIKAATIKNTGEKHDQQDQGAREIERALNQQLPTVDATAARYNLGSSLDGLGARLGKFQIEDIRV